MKKVLLITARFDPQADLLLAEFRRRGAPCVRWNTHEFPADSSLTYRASNSEFGGQVLSDGHLIDLSEVGSIWWQWDQPKGFPLDLTGPVREFAEREAHAVITALTTIGDFYWVNHPLREYAAESKAAQLYIARQVGLEIPRTIISNDPAIVKEFVAGSAKPVVYKAFSQPRLIEQGKVLFTGEVTEERLANIDLIKLTPGIFQERIDKAYELRITVVGSNVFAAKIDSQAIDEAKLDWRKISYDLEYELVQLPPVIEARLLRFMEAFGLVYSAFDFIVTPEGRYVFLENNPSGVYMWLESATSARITAAIADALTVN